MVDLRPFETGAPRTAAARFRHCPAVVAMLIAAAFGTASAEPAANNGDPIQDLKGLSLEALADLEVSIASKRPEPLREVPAAVFVITADDIRRSGVTTIADALRMVPGLSVASISGAQYAVSSRGFNSQLANKLLVLIDGRSVYTPLFSGVFWEVQDVYLKDIDRIEVVRGPGAATWGANAVNGVVNIITKSSHDTLGGSATPFGGNLQHEIGARFDGSLGSSGAYRIYAKTRERDALPGTADDDTPWDGNRAGFRTDWDIADADRLTVQGDIYEEENSVLHNDGVNLLARWDHDHTGGSSGMLQFYFDQTTIDNQILDEKLDTFDLEYRWRPEPSDRHDFIVGAGFRYLRSDIVTVAPNQIFEPVRTDSVISAFAQDDIRLAGTRWYLTVGTKFEDNDYSGFEVQPSARLRWTVAPSTTLWTGISRAVRTPSRGEDDITLESLIAPPSPATGGLPVYMRSSSDRLMDAEDLVAYELGARWQPLTRLALDVALFYNDYEKLRSVDLDLSPPVLDADPFPRLVQTASIQNNLNGTTRGVELLVDWRPRDWWRVQATGTLLSIDVEPTTENTDPIAEQAEGESPERQLSVRSSFDVGRHVELDAWARFVDELPALGVDSYTTLDLRVGWRPAPPVQLSIVGRNLLEHEHQEFGAISFVGGSGGMVEREVHLRVDWDF